MISVGEAKRKILAAQETGVPVTVALAGAVGRILAEDAFSPIDLPPFDASAMDGFALLAADTAGARESLPVVLSEAEKIWAGKVPGRDIVSGSCARIMTGAKMPRGADAVVMREDVVARNGGIAVVKPVPAGANVRRSGEELRSGEKLLEAGTVLGAAATAFLAGSGLDRVSVHPAPRVTIIPTGSELQTPGWPLSGAQIYESNSFALAAALVELGLESVVMPIVPDDPEALLRAISAALETSTHVLLSGGVSVGDFDHNKGILADCGVETVLWKIAQKPGKPLYVGRKGRVMAFGLPGNPASALTCFYEYAWPALKKYMGHGDGLGLAVARARLAEALSKKPGLTHFIRGCTSRGDGRLFVASLSKQHSHMMSSFASADCLIVLPEEASLLSEDDEVEIHVLPGKGGLCA